MCVRAFILKRVVSCTVINVALQFSQLSATESSSIVPVVSHCSLFNSFLLSGLIAVLTGFLGLGDRSGLLGANAALGRLYGLSGLGRGGSTRGGGGTRTRGGSLILGLLGTKHTLQTRSLVRRAAVLILLEIGKTAGLSVNVCDLPLALRVYNRTAMVSKLLGVGSRRGDKELGTPCTYRSRPASCRWGCW